MLITDKDYIEAAEAYMKEKYGEDFKGLFEQDTKIYMNPVEHQEWQVKAHYEKINNRVIFHDNYVGYLKKRELEKYIHDLIQPIYGGCRVYVRPYGFSLDDSWNRDTDILTYTSKANFSTYIYTYGDLDKGEENLDKVCKIFTDYKIFGNDLSVSYITKQDYNEFEEKSIDYRNNYDKYYIDFRTIYSKKDKSFDKFEILEGDKNYGK